MAVVHLDRPRPEGERQHLVAEADAEDRDLGLLQHLPDHRHRILAGRRRVARTVREEQPLGPVREHLLGGRSRRQHGHVAAGGGEAAQDVALGAVVDRDHPPPRALAPLVAFGPGPAHLVPAVALGAGDVLGEVHALEPGEGARARQQVVEVEVAVRRMADRHVRRALQPDRPRQPAGVDAADPDPPAPRQPRRELAGGAPARRLGRVPLHHHAGGERILGLVVLGVHPDVADVREGEGDDLPGVGGIGHDLLVAGHRGVEAELADRDPGGAEAAAPEDLAVGQRDAGGRLRARGRARRRAPGRRARHGRTSATLGSCDSAS